jgi:porphobilinogen synthase
MHSNIHQAQSHTILRSWQSQRNDVNHHKDFVLPMFIGNNDDACEPIESMPGVFRYGCNRAIEYLEPLVNRYGLAAVLLFPVVMKPNNHTITTLGADGDLSSDNADELSSTSSPSRSSSSSSSAAVGSSRSSSSSSISIPNVDGEGAGSAGGLKAQRKRSSMQDRSSSIAAVANCANDTNANNNNPFLSQNEETENLLGPEHQAEEQRTGQLDCEPAATIGDRWTIPVASQEITSSSQAQTAQLLKVSKATDIRLIKGMALQDKHNPVLRLIPELRAKYPGLLIICDVCLCAFTSTGHCCLFEDHARARGQQPAANPHSSHYPISNKLTCQYLAMLSVEYARKGCNVVAPSDMMDGRISAIRQKLDESGLRHVSMLSYSAKFASALYGPFRQATDNAPEFGDRRAYQLPPGSRALALKAVQRDIDQGADIVMVKPASIYLDIVRDIKNEHPEVPIAVYHVSGEYSTLMLAAQAGLVNLEQALNETLTAFRRAGSTIIITYFTPDILRSLVK